MEEWSIAVKTVGGHNDFMVTVHPDDSLKRLQDEIEQRTGVEPNQQRLIYRGRLIQNDTNETSVVRDVDGLSDGQTIHLVPKRNDNDVPTTSNEESDNSNNTALSSSSDSVGRSLLATLLGLGSLDEDNDETSSPSMRRLRRNRSRRASHRLTHADLVAQDPGSMEPVRQGLLTLHTMLETAHNTADEQEQPWNANRQWYRGQWVDCRDTVNQWLEATIVDIAYPDDILPERTIDTSGRQRMFRPFRDDAVSANDYEGRRNLLLEPDGQGAMRERQSNHGVHLLLIHYNGWPHRWDEWIRSDSERLRPFRTRTRHNPSSGVLPAPQAVFDGAPSTNIKDEDEEGDRAALLPELSRAMASVNDILQNVVSTSTLSRNVPGESPRPTNTDLPWLSNVSDDSSEWPSAEEPEPRYSRRQLHTLAPLLDRLGRALTDAAPHVAAFAASLPPDDEAFPAESRTDPENNVIIVGEDNVEEEPAAAATTSSGFFSLLSRDRSRSNAAAVEPENTTSAAHVQEEVRDEDEETVFDPDYVDFVNGVVNTTRGETRGPGGRRSASDDGASLLGAYLALSSLASDTESSNNGGGGMLGRLLRERGNGNNDGGGGPAIDIHIHAIVTGPGVGPTGAMAMLPAPPLVTAAAVPSTTTSSGRGGLFSSRRGNAESSNRARAASQTDEDDMGIFADLYSENPSPLDPNDEGAVVDNNVDAVAEQEQGNGGEDANRSSRGRSSSRDRSSHGRSPRRSNTFGRVVRGVLGSSRRRSARSHPDSNAPYEA